MKNQKRLKTGEQSTNRLEEQSKGVVPAKISHFMGLPVEIRTAIYRLALPAKIPYRYPSIKPKDIALLRVNRQVHCEAKRTLLAHTIFGFEVRVGIFSSYAFGCEVACVKSKFLLTSVRNVMLEIVFDSYWGEDIPWDMNPALRYDLKPLVGISLGELFVTVKWDAFGFFKTLDSLERARTRLGMYLEPLKDLRSQQVSFEHRLDSWNTILPSEEFVFNGVTAEISHTIGSGGPPSPVTPWARLAAEIWPLYKHMESILSKDGAVNVRNKYESLVKAQLSDSAEEVLACWESINLMWKDPKNWKVQRRPARGPRKLTFDKHEDVAARLLKEIELAAEELRASITRSQAGAV
ncbi:MAG: hypothetical protein M1820_004517 [Bogoriella megaspora]|nr:MAG: hypothetical protein M1820_004517 [Bogoriella megaspora]